MNAIQEDIGRQTKVLVASAAVVLIAGAYLAYSYSGAASVNQSAVNAVLRNGSTPVVESEHYSEVLEKYNVRNASAASQSKETYVSVFSSRPQTVPPAPALARAEAYQLQAPTTPFPPAPSDGIAEPSQRPAPGQAPSEPPDPKQQERLAQQTEGLLQNWAAVPHSTARIGEIERTRLPDKPAIRLDALAPHGKAESRQPHLVVPVFSLVPALLGTDIDTDEDSMVEAFIPSGAFAGATLYAMGYKRMNDSVDMTFTFMKWKNRSYRINAKSIDKSTMRSSLSGEVNNRYFSRILLPALAIGLARTGQLFEQANTQTVVTPFGGQIQSRSGSPSGRTIAGAIASGAAEEAGQVLRADAAQLPVKQVLIPRNETIGIRFIDPVVSSDEVEPQVDKKQDAMPAPAAPESAGKSQPDTAVHQR
ncbi:conjugal transfer protein TraO [Massilia atriviolacea]|uniref:Uncharacterized protein n=1 Tax=Massilia atriviolacea TaxID=2495579 RepID=A0A430HCK8_9BURK|nr:conjugal transfer protein TraO [Massilia atriviolacea]RSZ55244.1 hypothetical protein EJB06_30435 [Massilia atriviolacea]